MAERGAARDDHDAVGVDAAADGSDRARDAPADERDGGTSNWARGEILKRSRAAGASDAALKRAAEEGRLPTLAVELALGGVPQYTLTALARGAGLDTAYLRRLMQAAGRPTPAPRQRAFTEEDLELARLVRTFLDLGLPREGLLDVARVLGQGMTQMAEAIRRLVADTFLEPGDSEYTLGLRYAEVADGLTPLVGPLLEFELRALLREGISRNLVTEAEQRSGELSGKQEVAVAFADLVDYTSLGEKLPLEDVGRIAARLAELAGAAVQRPAQLVKTIGDAAMFVSAEAAPLIDTVAALRESVVKEGEEFPALRVGIAHGPATARGGDWFGTTVNLASRIADVAKPGRILASQEAVEAAGEGYEWKRRRRRGLKGIEGRTRLLSLETGD
jgi:adenylate cyclase